MEENYNFSDEMERANDLINNADAIIRKQLTAARKAGNVEKQQTLQTLLDKVYQDHRLFTGNTEIRHKIIDEYPAFVRELYNGIE